MLHCRLWFRYLEPSKKFFYYFTLSGQKLDRTFLEHSLVMYECPIFDLSDFLEVEKNPNSVFTPAPLLTTGVLFFPSVCVS